MTATLEFLGSLKKGEHVWIQIMIQAHKKLKLADGVLFARPDWKADARKVIKEVMKSATVKPEGQEEGNGYINLSPGETDKVKAIERSLAKFPFETMIRGIYLSEKESFNPNNIPALIGTFRQYNSNELNGFRLGWITDFDYPWQDFRRMRRNTAERQMLDAYKKRSFFQYPYKNLHIKKPFILTTEEIATIFHFPGGVAKTPTVDRILSKKAEPPANLPM